MLCDTMKPRNLNERMVFHVRWSGETVNPEMNHANDREEVELINCR